MELIETCQILLYCVDFLVSCLSECAFTCTNYNRF